MRPDDIARAVEARSFECLLFTDHTHIPATAETTALMAEVWEGGVTPPYARVYDLFVALAWAAAATERLLVGTGVCLMPLRDPITTAKQVASVDVLSGGRMLFGVGAGWVPEEVANHGVVPARRWSVMSERVEAMRRI
jgi:alkanesulfonate monooxygenase SsuD/methylene tetrahydromethanopterin reductase-like flavin-dependent oxidoreductase (luciferase family)